MDLGITKPYSISNAPLIHSLSSSYNM